MRRWAPKFMGTVVNETAPGGKVDMYLVNDEWTGETAITIAVPHGDAKTAKLVCDAVNAWPG